jgi:hypothetical protein
MHSERIRGLGNKKELFADPQDLSLLFLCQDPMEQGLDVTTQKFVATHYVHSFMKHSFRQDLPGWADT